jgi:hypothetical protein
MYIHGHFPSSVILRTLKTYDVSEAGSASSSGETIQPNQLGLLEIDWD